MVIPIPNALLIEPEDEHIGPLYLADQGAAIVAPGHRIAQRRIEAFQHRGLLQEVLDISGMALQHFVQQEIGHVPVVAGEVPDETGLVGMMAQGHCRQLQADDPAFSALSQYADLLMR